MLYPLSYGSDKAFTHLLRLLLHICSIFSIESNNGIETILWYRLARGASPGQW